MKDSPILHYAVDFAPLLPLWLLSVLGMAALALLLFSLWRRLRTGKIRGLWARGLFFAFLMLVLANPLMVEEQRVALPDVVALVLDRSQSMDVGQRKAQSADALAQVKAQLQRIEGLDIREADIVTNSSGEDRGSEAFAAIGRAVADVPPERLAGAILISDGQIHDVPAPERPALKMPLHVLLAGTKQERDRKLSVVTATRYAIVGERASITVRVDDFGGAAQGMQGMAELTIWLDGARQSVQSVALGRETVLQVALAHGGENVVELEVAPGPDELTLDNNRAVVTISGVRDRLRVLLVSGEPHAGERVWRNLLKADPSVDLVHFTILRPPDKQDGTPIDELSLIAFPTRQLFDEKLSSFDLVIFDRYSERSILPLAYYENLARYVEDGGALLVSAGPEYAEMMSIYRTPLAAVLPARPTGEVLQQSFRPRLTEAGMAHPVTRSLPGANGPNQEAQWGRWFRLIGAEKISGETVMQGPGGQPLLVLDHRQKGRVAELLSDQAWLWARGFEGGGPQAELLRRLAHWLMKEPELEEERLSAVVQDGKITIERRSMQPAIAPVMMRLPMGAERSVEMRKVEPGIWRGSAPARQLGLYRLRDDKLTAVAAAGPLNPREVADMRATANVLERSAQASGGSVHWLEEGVPVIRHGASSTQGGAGWIGLRANQASRVSDVAQRELIPAWFAALGLIGALFLVWWRESR